MNNVYVANDVTYSSTNIRSLIFYFIGLPVSVHRWEIERVPGFAKYHCTPDSLGKNKFVLNVHSCD